MGARVEDLRRRLRQAERVGLDSMVFIYLIEDHLQYVELAQATLEAVERGECEAVAPAIVLTEVLAKAEEAGADGLAQAYRALIVGFPHLTVAAVGIDEAVRAAELRGTAARAGRSLRGMDALMLATAELAGAKVFVTNDRRLQGLDVGPEVIILDDYRQ